eukprot:gene192-93_t
MVQWAAELEPLVSALQKRQEVLQQQYDSRQKLIGQETENEMVKKEFENLTSDSNVYKAVGPILVKQDKEEAKANVAKRIEY